ncbi:DNA ligase [Dickeya phage Mysterion]|uniref:DNA ligase n=1 Tax=Dickeya phage Mysterion TaxID=2320193 RepID=A0A385IGT0_9CAUD|nr:DNA ligase [Dickeya phage Mysterion]AXY81944.1 DNA ligase [Dickeya phage Mysterion]
MKTNPYKAVDYKESAIVKALAVAESLIADIKHDGVRLNLCVKSLTDRDDGETDAFAQYLSRVGKTIPALEHLNGFSERWFKFLNDDEQPFSAGLMIDGEVMVKGVDFNTSSGLLRTKWLKPNNEAFASCYPGRGTKVPFHLDPKRLKVVVYGVVPMDVVESGEDYDVMNVLMQMHCAVQVALLERHFPEIEWVLPETHNVFSMEELHALYANVRELGHEGLVVKDPFGIYRRGKKSGWWKMKPENEADGIVQGLVWGTEGLANEGKVIGFEVLLENGRVVNACNISKDLMDEFTTAYESYNDDIWNNEMTDIERETCGIPESNPFEGYQVQIKYMEETPDGSLRHPSFVCFRGTESNPEEKI